MNEVIKIAGDNLPQNLVLKANRLVWVQPVDDDDEGSGSGSGASEEKFLVVGAIPIKIDVQTDVRIDGKRFQKKRREIYAEAAEEVGSGSEADWDTYHTGTSCQEPSG